MNLRFESPASGEVTTTGRIPGAPTRMAGTETTICVGVALVGVSTAVPRTTRLPGRKILSRDGQVERGGSGDYGYRRNCCDLRFGNRIRSRAHGEGEVAPGVFRNQRCDDDDRHVAEAKTPAPGGSVRSRPCEASSSRLTARRTGFPSDDRAQPGRCRLSRPLYPAFLRIVSTRIPLVRSSSATRIFIESV